MKRRTLVTGAAMMPITPWVRASARSVDADFVVIGAGAAGLAATQTLRSNGKTTVTIEAAPRIGGRVHTDLDSFGVPFDIGAHWLDTFRDRHFIEHGSANGYDVYRAPDSRRVYDNGGVLGDDDLAELDAVYQLTLKAIGDAGRFGRDVSAAAVVPDGGRWHDLVHFLIGPWEMGKDYAHFSCQDWWNSSDPVQYYCRQGYGALVAHAAKDVPARLSTTATKVAWKGPHVSVETNRGTLRAHGCIITVSTGVLSSNRIKFEPALPLELASAFHDLSMGNLEHIGLLFDGNPLGTGQDEYVYRNGPTQGAESPALMGLLTNVGGTKLTVASVGGAFGRELARQGEPALIDFAREELSRVFGSKVLDGLVKARATRWASDPLTLGSYASAEPGSWRSRATLREPFDNRLWFAGEACSRDEWATVVGARRSGIEVAHRAMRKLRG